MSEINIVFESMLKEAVAANFNNKMEAMPSEEELLRMNPPSVNHVRYMKSLFRWARRRDAVKKLFSFSKAAVFVLCVFSTLFFAAMMFSPSVRAAVRDVIVQFFDGFTRIEFSEPGETSRAAGSFALGYIPEGYSMASIEVNEDSCLMIYKGADGDMLTLFISASDAHMGDIDNRDYRTETYANAIYYVFEARTADDYSNITWMQNGLVFNLTGAIPIGELLKTAHSLE